MNYGSLRQLNNLFSEPDNSALESGNLMTVPNGKSWATSDIDSNAQNSDLLSRFDAAYRILSECNGIVDHSPSPLTSVTMSFDFGHSSSAFTPDGPARTKLQAYWARVCALRHSATEDGYTFNLASESDFWCFVKSEPRWRKGNLVLMDNGNLRAVWKSCQGTRLGLQFLGSGMVQFVIFKQRGAMQPTSSVAGRDTFSGLKRQIYAFELDSLLHG